MKTQMKELQQLKGIGQVLSHRLVESSYDTIAKVAAANISGLGRIPGMNSQKVHAISAQARRMTGEVEKNNHSWSQEKDDSEQQVAQDTTMNNRDRFKN
jgi:Holliday junction resolvasome RuvABC DNA-binding subunit